MCILLLLRGQTFKKHNATADEVEDAYQYYASRSDPEVLEAAAPIKVVAGPYLIDKAACLRLMQVSTRFTASVGVWRTMTLSAVSVYFRFLFFPSAQMIADAQCENASKVVALVAQSIPPVMANANQIFQRSMQECICGFEALCPCGSSRRELLVPVCPCVDALGGILTVHSGKHIVL